MARTADAAAAKFYSAATRDCACGCGGHCHDTFPGEQVYDAALRTLDEAKGAAKPGVGGKGPGLWPNVWRKRRREHLARTK